MKKWILWALFSLCIVSNAKAVDCNVYQDKIHRLEDLRRHGGSLKQMERWRMQADELTSKKSRCNSQRGTIQIATGRPAPSYTKAKTNKTASIKSSRTLNTTHTYPTITSSDATPPTADLPILHSLKDCIKPNNLIDNDVQECRQGLRDPTWKR